MTKKILIVEDELSILNILVQKLIQEGYEVFKSSDGVEGLELALKEHPDLILLDIIMPKMDGMTMLNELRKDQWGKTVRVIILTNLSNNEKELQAKENLVEDYIVKANLSLQDVVKKINAVLA